MNSIDSKQVEQFYDDFVVRSLRDYIYGNRRIVAAVQRVLGNLPETPCRILEVGCGMGIATEMIAQARPDCKITAIDISPKRIEYAGKLFPRPNVEFIASDVAAFLEKNPPSESFFDVVYMIDVVEHLPKDLRLSIFEDLGRLIASNGKLILTYPTVLKQANLRSTAPHELQIIDEDISFEQISEIAAAIRADVTFHQYIAVWAQNDYAHTVFERHPPFGNKPIPNQKAEQNQQGLPRKILSKIRRCVSFFLKKIVRDKQPTEIEKRRAQIERMIGSKFPE